MITLDVINTSPEGGRFGQLHTPHGRVATPAFMPVGTYGSVRGLTPAQLKAAGVEILLANAYHLALRPGAETISKLGGLHAFMGWNGPILTDSGGFQIFSLRSMVKITEAGATFRSHLDGSLVEMSPERVVEIERLLGVDIGMILDVVIDNPSDRSSAAKAAEQSVRWARRAADAADSASDTSHFAIMQGGLFEDLRRENAEQLIELDFPGYAVGGLSVGEDKNQTMSTAAYSVGLLPTDKPRYMMGMGTPRDLVELMGMGYDMFDCVMPTRNARNATLFTSEGTLAIRNHQHAEDTGAVDANCDCYTCTTVSRAYLHHLFKRKEMLGPILASIHNIHFYQRIMKSGREALETGEYPSFASEFLSSAAADGPSANA